MCRGEEQKPKIALTFDDRPNIKYTLDALDGLKERGSKQHFSDRSKHRTRKQKAIVKRMYEEGHLIGIIHIVMSIYRKSAERLVYQKDKNYR